ncbi:MAG: 50S ribosomal protein L21 [Candidatus Vogelbacteria bacterium]|nr:50S ribosomal protein L21 [Candidatus Vogelbacteria bacterium]
MSFAIIKTGGKQYKVAVGEVLKIEKLAKPVTGDELVFNEVLLTDDGEKTVIGAPLVTGAAVTAKFLEEGRAKKITVVKFKSKVNYRNKRGHRQPYTKVQISHL